MRAAKGAKDAKRQRGKWKWQRREAGLATIDTKRPGMRTAKGAKYAKRA
jgi:hypothetical protein